MSRSTAAIFHDVYNGQRNFMTPSVIMYGEEGSLLWELSTGRGMRDQPIFGVTVLELHGGDVEKRGDLSGCFQSKREALRYIAGLGGE